MEAAEREMPVIPENVDAGDYLGAKPTPGGQGMEALKDIAFGSVRTVTSPYMSPQKFMAPQIWDEVFLSNFLLTFRTYRRQV